MVHTHSNKGSHEERYQYLVTCSLTPYVTSVCVNDEIYSCISKESIRNISRKDSAVVKMHTLYETLNRTPMLTPLDTAELEDAFYGEETATEADERHGFISMLLCAVGLSV